MAASDNGVAVPPKLGKTCPSRSVGTGRAYRRTSVRDGFTPFAAFALQVWHDHAKLRHNRAKVSGCYLLCF